MDRRSNQEGRGEAAVAIDDNDDYKEMKRLRRLRKSIVIRNMIAETKLSVNNLILPYFVMEGKNKKQAVKSMPNICRFSRDNLLGDLESTCRLGIRAILLFAVIDKKRAPRKVDTTAYSSKGIVQKTVRAVKKEFPQLTVITDVCLCSYTWHGHCGMLKPPAARDKMQDARCKLQASIKNLKPAAGSLQLKAVIDNDATLKILGKIALSHSEAGADFVAPSAMMDGQVGAIRQVLDKDGFVNTGILSYSAKYASNFYAPFREVLDSAPKFGDRATYQMDFRNSYEALREVDEDIKQGADIVMVKPALAYLDIIRRVKDRFNVPLAAYNVSGEYAMVKLLSRNDREAEKNLTLEIVTSLKRAGADIIITYHAKELTRWLKDTV